MGSMRTLLLALYLSCAEKNSLNALLCGDNITFTFCAVIPVYAKREKLQKKVRKTPLKT